MADATVLSKLVADFSALEHQEPLVTRDFCVAIGHLIPVFESLGTIFSLPKGELVDKRQSLIVLEDNFTTLQAIVDEDKRKKTVTVKGSPARNLQRLGIILDFVSCIFKNMLQDKNKLFRVAVTEAYDETLGKIHAWAVRTAIKTGMYALPTTENFLKNLGETDASAEEKAKKFVPVADVVVKRVFALYKGVNMPGSDVKFLPKS